MEWTAVKFVEKLRMLKTNSVKDTVQRENGSILIEPGNIPKYRHILFQGLKRSDIDEYLVANYNNTFPKEYAELLQAFNGANLCTVKVRVKAANISFAESLLTIYGLPRTQPFNRPADIEEPFDLRIEDLARNEKIPSSWLKCAGYDKMPGFIRIDVFVDTGNGKVYACQKNEAEILRNWGNLDACLCDLFDEMSVMPTEYEV